MRAASSVVSLTTHVMVVAAALWATETGAHPRAPQPPIMLPIGPSPVTERDTPAPWAPPIVGDPTIPNIPLPNVEGGLVAMPRFTIDAQHESGPLLAATTAWDGAPIESSLVDELPMMLTGPAPAYPDLLRQAGVRGRVVLEAVIDTLGHVEPGSVLVVESAHPAFVAPAQHSLLASLFRPARVRGRAVRVRVRLAFDFVLRDGRL